MTTGTIVIRTALGAILAILILALFGEMRVGTASFLMTTAVLTGLARDIATYRRAA